MKKNRTVGPILAKAVKSKLIAAHWLRSTVFDFGSMEELAAILPAELTFRRAEACYLPAERFVIIGDFTADDDGEPITTAVFVNNNGADYQMAACYIDWERNKISHPDALCFLDDFSRMEQINITDEARRSLGRFAANVNGFRYLAKQQAGLLSYLFKSDYARQVVERTERRTPIGRAQKLPFYEIQRRTLKVDWFTYYRTNPSCRQNLPSGVTSLPLHDVVQHWCERQLSGDPACAHEWHFHDERNKTCTKCGRVSWFRDTHYRGDEKNGVIVHDRVTGKRFKAAA